jgi:hypothetical protein
MRPRSTFLAFALSGLAVAACSASGDDRSFADSGAGAGSGSGDASGVGGGFSASSSTGSGFGGGETCGASTYANAVPASVLLVLDKSGSMAGGDGAPDKWAPTTQALEAMMSAASPDLNVGLLPFPAGHFDASGLAFCTLSPSDPACAALFADGGCTDVDATPAVPVGPLSQSHAPISGWLASNGPDGGTPTLYALKTAYDILRALPAEGERFALLITDGEPNVYTPEMNLGPFSIPESNIECKDLAAIEAEALSAAQGAPPVKTFVIGAPGSESAGSFLSQVAVNGQTPRSVDCSPAAANCHYQIGAANFQSDLQAALDQIAGQLQDCIFAIPQGSEEVDPNKVNVVVETSGGSIQTYKDVSHQDGWDYTDESHTTIELFGPACEAYKAEEGAKVSIVLGCETVVK